MDIEQIGFLLDGLGKLLVSYTAIAVHYRFRKEHKVDEAVFSEMRREYIIGMLGILCIIFGMAFEYAGRFGGM